MFRDRVNPEGQGGREKVSGLPPQPNPRCLVSYQPVGGSGLCDATQGSLVREVCPRERVIGLAAEQIVLHRARTLS